MPEDRKSNLQISIILIFTLFLLLPIILKPELYLGRSNDLTEFFWPIIYFIKNTVIANHSLPLWNNLFLSGTPLSADPQNPAYYPVNLIFMLFPLEKAFLLHLILHIFISGVGMYLICFDIFKLPKKSALLAALMYQASPKLAGFIEAGHLGLIATFALIPWSFYFLNKFFKTNSLYYYVLFIFTLSFILFNHVLTFLIVVTFIIAWSLVKHRNTHHVLWLMGAFILTIMTSAVSFLPQILWIGDTTRNLLIKHPDIYPKWSWWEYLYSVIAPYLNGYKYLWSLDTEKYLALGIFPLWFSFLGLRSLKRKYAVLIILLMLFVFLFAANNLSPFYPILIKQSWYDILRVATRVWVIPVFIIPILSALGYSRLLKKNTSKIILELIFLIFLLELTTLFWFRLDKPISSNEKYAKEEVYQYLSYDPDHFRVFCLTRCLTQKQSAEYGLELVDGYSTLSQTNYNHLAWQFTHSFWDYYSLSIPPMGLYTQEKINPDVRTLGELNVKYLLAPYQLLDPYLLERKQIGNIRIYENTLFKPRAYYLNDDLSISEDARVITYSPNHIRIEVTAPRDRRLILAEVYSKGWKAYTDKGQFLAVQERPNSLRLVDIPKETKLLEFYYDPPGFSIGFVISFITISILIFFGWKSAIIRYARNRA